VLRLHYDLGSVERGPIPPHERTWRHPSEIAAEERAVLRAEAAAPSTRVFALTTGTIGLLAVGVLILTVSPRQQESPIAISATTTPLDADPAGTTGVGDTPRALTVLSSTVATRPARLTEATAGALATPIGDGSFALVTGRSLAGRAESNVDVRLADGRVTEAEVVAGDDQVVVVALAAAAPGHAIARHRPDDGDMVTVMVEPPVVVAYADVDTVAVHEGTAVLNDEGAVVALCSRARSGRGIELLEVTAAVAGATSADR
jgi:hypothetical protein